MRHGSCPEFVPYRGLEELAQGLVHRYACRRRKIQAAYLLERIGILNAWSR